MIVSRHSQRPAAEELAIFTQETSSRPSRRERVATLVDRIADAQKLLPSLRHELPHANSASAGTRADIEGRLHKRQISELHRQSLIAKNLPHLGHITSGNLETRDKLVLDTALRFDSLIFVS